LSRKSPKKAASVASAQKAVSGKNGKLAKAGSVKAKAAASRSTAAKSTASRKSGQKTVSSLQAKSGRSRS
ncbi:hypothetical protein, partial [Desulfovibrio sp.]|uniref:hypothetical protein n=1 Tax=Desulfovibrio sp. TaxID=885 RepID=UPI0023C747E4